MELNSPADVVVLTILALAALRGLWLGLIREAFSLLALGLAVIGVRLFTEPLATWIVDTTGVGWSPLVANMVAGITIAVATLLAVALVGRGLRRGARAVGLGWLDRIGGSALGATEGALVAALLLLLTVTLAGRDHPLVADSHSLRAFEALEQMAAGDTPATRDVAAPPKR